MFIYKLDAIKFWSSGTMKIPRHDNQCKNVLHLRCFLKLFLHWCEVSLKHWLYSWHTVARHTLLETINFSCFTWMQFFKEWSKSCCFLFYYISIGIIIYTFHWTENYCFPPNYKDDGRKMSHLLVTSFKYLVSNTSISACISILSKISVLLKFITSAVLPKSAAVQNYTLLIHLQLTKPYFLIIFYMHI